MSPLNPSVNITLGSGKCNRPEAQGKLFKIVTSKMFKDFQQEMNTSINEINETSNSEVE